VNAVPPALLAVSVAVVALSLPHHLGHRQDFTKVLGALDATAPAQIAPDLRAVTEWFRTRWSEVVGNFDYDYRRLLLDGTPEDRAVFNRFHPDIVEHWSRTKAYVEQVCTAP